MLNKNFYFLLSFVGVADSKLTCQRIMGVTVNVVQLRNGFSPQEGETWLSY